MKKIILAILFLPIYAILFSQQAKNKIIKISFLSLPLSQYQVNSNASISEQERTASLDLQKGYKFYYTLYINPQTEQSIYKLDTLVINKPKGKENEILTVNDSLSYCVRKSSKDYLKYETVFEREFYSIGSVSDIEWVITNEKKELFGFECTKAISKNKDLLITVWFTSKVPVSSGPVNYFGLPGLIVWSEDFFRTNLLEKIDYIDSFPFEEELKKYEELFNKNKGKNLIKESVYLEKKVELVKSMIRAMNIGNE